ADKASVLRPEEAGQHVVRRLRRERIARRTIRLQAYVGADFLHRAEQILAAVLVEVALRRGAVHHVGERVPRAIVVARVSEIDQLRLVDVFSAEDNCVALGILRARQRTAIDDHDGNVRYVDRDWGRAEIERQGLEIPGDGYRLRSRDRVGRSAEN